MMKSNRKTFSIALWLLVFATLIENSGNAQEIKPQELYKKSLASIMTLQVQKKDGSFSLGSGFLAIKEGLAVTAWHVVSDAKAVSVRFSDGEEYEASGLVDKDEKRDVAIIRVKVFGRPTISLASLEPEVGIRVFAIGAPKGLEFSISDGILSQKQIIEGVRLFQFTSPVSPGNSGCPLLNSRAEVIGVVSWQLKDGQNLNFAVPSIYVLGLDTSLPTKPWPDVRPVLPTSSNQGSRTEVDKLLSAILILQIDLSTAYMVTSEIEHKDNGFKDGIPSFVYSLERELKDKQKALSSLVIGDSASKALARTLQASADYMLEGVNLLIEAIKTAQSQGGWNAGPNDLVSRSYAAFNLAGMPAPEELRTIPSLMDMLPREVKEMVGLENDSTGFRFGVWNWVNNPLALVLVPDKSFAHKLGFRTGDVIVEVNGSNPESIGQVKRIIAANAGKDIPVLVIREGEREKIEIKIPETLPPE